MNGSMIELYEAIKEFLRGDAVVRAVDEVTLTVRMGEFVSMVGKSGSGKSTHLHLMSGLLTPIHGTVRLPAAPAGTTGGPAAGSLGRAHGRDGRASLRVGEADGGQGRFHGAAQEDAYTRGSGMARPSPSRWRNVADVISASGRGRGPAEPMELPRPTLVNTQAGPRPRRWPASWRRWPPQSGRLLAHAWSASAAPGWAR